MWEVDRRRTGAGRLALMLCVALVTGCTVTERFEEGVRVSRSMIFGTPSLDGCPPGGARDRITNIGVALDKGDMVIGYRRTDRTCLPTSTCAAIFFVAGTEQAAVLRDLFPNLASACVIEEAQFSTP